MEPSAGSLHAFLSLPEPDPAMKIRKEPPTRARAAAPSKKPKKAGAGAGAGRQPGGPGGAGAGRHGSIAGFFTTSSAPSDDMPVLPPKPPAPTPLLMERGIDCEVAPVAPVELHSFFRQFLPGTTSIGPGSHTTPTRFPRLPAMVPPAGVAGAGPDARTMASEQPTVATHTAPTTAAAVSGSVSTSASASASTSCTTVTGSNPTRGLRREGLRRGFSGGPAPADAVQDELGVGGDGGRPPIPPSMDPPLAVLPPLPDGVQWSGLMVLELLEPGVCVLMRRASIFSSEYEKGIVLRAPRKGGGSAASGTDAYLVMPAALLNEATSLDAQLELFAEKANVLRVEAGALKVPRAVLTGMRDDRLDFTSLITKGSAESPQVMLFLMDLCTPGKSLYGFLHMVHGSKPEALVTPLAAMLCGVSVASVSERAPARTAKKADALAKAREDADTARDAAREDVLLENPTFDEKQIAAEVQRRTKETNHVTRQPFHDAARRTVTKEAYDTSKAASDFIKVGVRMLTGLLTRYAEQLASAPPPDFFDGVNAPFVETDGPLDPLFHPCLLREEEEDVDQPDPLPTPAAIPEGGDGQADARCTPTVPDPPTPTRCNGTARRRGGEAAPGTRWAVPQSGCEELTGLVPASVVFQHHQVASQRMRTEAGEAVQKLQASLVQAHAQIAVPGEGPASRIGSKDLHCKDAADLILYGQNITSLIDMAGQFKKRLFDPTVRVLDPDELVGMVEAISAAGQALEDATEASAYAAAYARAVAFLSSLNRTKAAMVVTTKATFEACLLDYAQLGKAMTDDFNPTYADQLHTTEGPTRAAARMLAGEGSATPTMQGNLGYSPNPSLANCCSRLYRGPAVAHGRPKPTGAAAQKEETGKCLGHAEAALFVRTMRASLGEDFPDLAPGSTGTVADSVGTTYVVGAVSREPCSDACKVTLVTFCQQLNAELLLAFPCKVRGSKRYTPCFLRFTASGFQRLA